MVRQPELPERRISFPEACSDFEKQLGTAEAHPLGDIFSPFDQPRSPTSSLFSQTLRNSGGSFHSEVSPGTFPILSSLPISFLFPRGLLPPFLPQLLKFSYILSKTNCFLDLLQLKTFLPTWYVQWLWQRWPVLRRWYLKPRVHPKCLETAKCGWEVSSYINAHASFRPWLEAFPNRLQNY